MIGCNTHLLKHMKQAILVWSFRQNIFLGCYPEKTSKIGRAVDIVLLLEPQDWELGILLSIGGFNWRFAASFLLPPRLPSVSPLPRSAWYLNGHVSNYSAIPISVNTGSLFTTCPFSIKLITTPGPGQDHSAITTHWLFSSAEDDPSLSQSVFTITLESFHI